MADIEQIFEAVRRVILECGAIILSADRERILADQKSGFRDLVTKYDVRVQEHAIEALSAAFPDACFVCEEQDAASDTPDGMTFIIDPIDGTANFVHHFRHSCTSIACAVDGEVVLGAVYDPYQDELFHAIRGRGAYLNRQKLKIYSAPLSEVLVLFGTSPYNAGLSRDTFEIARHIYDQSQDVRRSGSAALDLCYVAAGRAGLFFEGQLSVWDYAAGALIVTEAGGMCTDYAGNRLPLGAGAKSSCVASCAQQLQQAGLNAIF